MLFCVSISTFCKNQNLIRVFTGAITDFLYIAHIEFIDVKLRQGSINLSLRVSGAMKIDI